MSDPSMKTDAVMVNQKHNTITLLKLEARLLSARDIW